MNIDTTFLLVIVEVVLIHVFFVFVLYIANLKQRHRTCIVVLLFYMIFNIGIQGFNFYSSYTTNILMDFVLENLRDCITISQNNENVCKDIDCYFQQVDDTRRPLSALAVLALRLNKTKYKNKNILTENRQNQTPIHEE